MTKLLGKQMNISQAGTTRTPTIAFENGKFSISGRSYMENSVEFYAPYRQALEEYDGPITVDIGLDFFNTSSSKCLSDLLNIVDRKAMNGVKCKIKWCSSFR